ncbi:hypothetical protein TNCV_1169741 [Trichonephila clavipes]|uniref:C2H2-type domain-containing protein n=1 Tax=Trichonephila clavipes TaxID=2585209 RepID=A0A8X6VTA5_TRICX|nr:hypothetical protein TNCV_1169741 [Trichonephila clavipes]
MDIEKIFEETDFPINDKVLASADFGDLSSELDEPFDGVLRGTFSCDKCDSVFTHRRSLERHRISIHTTSALFYCKICKKRFNRKDNFVRHSKIHKLTPIIMKLSRTANGEENSSANTSSEAALRSLYRHGNDSFRSRQDFYFNCTIAKTNCFAH